MLSNLKLEFLTMRNPAQNQDFNSSKTLKFFKNKFHGLVLGLVGLNDAKGIDFAQPIWP